MQVDIVLESKIGPEQFKELGLLAEELGFHGIWVQNYARAPDAFMTAMPLALASKRIRVGVAVISAYEMHPLKIANAVLTLNEAAQGRASVVLAGGGEWPGVMKVEIGKRVARLREALELIKLAFGDKVVNYDGEAYKAQAFTTSWKTQSPPLLYAGTNGPNMSVMATGIADGIMMSDVQPTMFDWTLPTLKKALADAGPAAKDFRLTNFLSWHVKEDREASLWESRRELIIRAWLEPQWISSFLSPEDVATVRANVWPFLTAFRARTGDIEGVDPRIVDALVEGLTCSGDLGDLDRHIERLKKYETAGFTEIALGLQDDPADSMRMLAERVLPKFQ